MWIENVWFNEAPETVQMKSGKSLVKGKITWEQGFGDRKEMSSIDYVAFEPLSLRMAKFVRPGSQFVAFGELTGKKNEHNGKTYQNYSVTIKELKLIGSGKAPEPPPAAKGGYDDSEVPF